MTKYIYIKKKLKKQKQKLLYRRSIFINEKKKLRKEKNSQ